MKRWHFVYGRTEVSARVQRLSALLAERGAAFDGLRVPSTPD